MVITRELEYDVNPSVPTSAQFPRGSRGVVDSRLDSRVGVFLLRFLEGLDLKFAFLESRELFQLISYSH